MWYQMSQTYQHVVIYQMNVFFITVYSINKIKHLFKNNGHASKLAKPAWLI